MNDMIRNTRRQVLAGSVAALSLAISAAEASIERRTSLRIAHLTDLHVMPERRAAIGMETCLEVSQSHHPNIIFMGGDLVMDCLNVDLQRAKEQWDVYKRIVQANTNLPIEACIGNHDVWGWGDFVKYKGEAAFGKRFALDMLELECPYRSFDHANWHFIVLDSTHQVSGNGYTAKLDEQQFEWLCSDLANTPQHRPILILSHIPILTVTAYLDGINEASGNWIVPGALMHVDARRLKDLFRAHPNVKLCLSGHTHLVDRADYLGVTYLCNGAVSGSWWKGRHQEFGNSFAIIDLYDDGSFDFQVWEYPWSPDL